MQTENDEMTRVREEGTTDILEAEIFEEQASKVEVSFTLTQTYSGGNIIGDAKLQFSVTANG